MEGLHWPSLGAAAWKIMCGTEFRTTWMSEKAGTELEWTPSNDAQLRDLARSASLLWRKLIFLLVGGARVETWVETCFRQRNFCRLEVKMQTGLQQQRRNPFAEPVSCSGMCFFNKMVSCKNGGQRSIAEDHLANCPLNIHNLCLAADSITLTSLSALPPIWGRRVWEGSIQKKSARVWNLWSRFSRF